MAACPLCSMPPDARRCRPTHRHNPARTSPWSTSSSPANPESSAAGRPITAPGPGRAARRSWSDSPIASLRSNPATTRPAKSIHLRASNPSWRAAPTAGVHGASRSPGISSITVVFGRPSRPAASPSTRPASPCAPSASAITARPTRKAVSSFPPTGATPGRGRSASMA